MSAARDWAVLNDCQSAIETANRRVDRAARDLAIATAITGTTRQALRDLRRAYEVASRRRAQVEEERGRLLGDMHEDAVARVVVD